MRDLSEMNYLTFEELLALAPPEREHLRQFEETLQDAILANSLAAKTDRLDTDLITRAILPILLSVAAREYLSANEDANTELSADEFKNMSEMALAWAHNRGSGETHTHH